MIGLVDCCVPCNNVEEIVNIPGPSGIDGNPGADGAAGENSFTFTVSDFVVPPADGTTPLTIEVESTGFMAVGQPLFIPGADFVIVSAIIDGTHFSAVSPDWESNTHAGDTISAGEKVSPSAWQPAAPSLPAIDAIAKYGSGTAHTIT